VSVARRAQAYPNVEIGAAALVNTAIALVRPGASVGEAVRLARRRDAPVVSVGGTCHVLREDLARASALGLDDLEAEALARPLPVVNKTGEKREAFWSYYTPEVQDYARRIFGPFMKEWGYEFPPEWGGRPFLARVRCSFDCSACCAGPIGDCAASDCLGERLEERKVR